MTLYVTGSEYHSRSTKDAKKAHTQREGERESSVQTNKRRRRSRRIKEQNTIRWHFRGERRKKNENDTKKNASVILANDNAYVSYRMIRHDMDALADLSKWNKRTLAIKNLFLHIYTIHCVVLYTVMNLIDAKGTCFFFVLSFATFGYIERNKTKEKQMKKKNKAK